MKRLLYLFPLLLLSALPARAQLANAQGWCEAGAQQVNTSGLLSSNTVQGSFPSCTISVSIHAGGIATIFSTGAGAPLSNPFTAQTNGRWLFYAANGEYDITMTGGGLTSPVTYSDVFIGTGGGGGGGVTSVTATSPIVATPNPITSAGTISCPTCNTSGATIAGSISTGQVAVGSATNTISGSANLTYTSQDLALLNSAANTLTLQNSTAANSGANQSSPITLAIGNYWTGAASAQDIYTFQDVVSAGNNPVTSLNFAHSGSSGGGNYGFAGNVNVSNSLTAANATVTGVGSLIFKGTGSGQAAIGVPTNAGTPNSLNLPTTTGTAGQFLQTDGGTPQQLSWQSIIPITGCSTTGGVLFENGTPNTATCGSLLTFNGTTFTDSASTTGTTTSHFGDPDSSFTNSNNLWGIFPGRNEFNAVSSGDDLSVMTVVGDGSFAAIGAYNYASSATATFLQGLATGAAYEGVTTGNALLGRFDLTRALNGANITGNGQETGFVASSRLEPHVTALTSGGAAGANSHADFLYGVHSNPVVGDGGTDGSTVTNVESYQSNLDVNGTGVVVTNYMGYEALDAVKLTSATITTQYGYHAAHMTNGGTNWGFYSDSANNDHFGAIQSGTDNSVAGSYQAANGSANAHTIWASGATTSNTIKGFATVPTNNHLVTCAVSSTTCTLTDGGASLSSGSLAVSAISSGTITTTTNCSSSASPAVCGSAAAGSVALPTNGVSSSIQVNTSAVTANSQIFAFADDTLGTKLGVTCNSTAATLVGGLAITARSAGVSFTISNNVAVAVNPLCVSYLIVN